MVVAGVTTLVNVATRTTRTTCTTAIQWDILQTIVRKTCGELPVFRVFLVFVRVLWHSNRKLIGQGYHNTPQLHSALQGPFYVRCRGLTAGLRTGYRVRCRARWVLASHSFIFRALVGGVLFVLIFLYSCASCVDLTCQDSLLAHYLPLCVWSNTHWVRHHPLENRRVARQCAAG